MLLMLYSTDSSPLNIVGIKYYYYIFNIYIHVPFVLTKHKPFFLAFLCFLHLLSFFPCSWWGFFSDAISVVTRSIRVTFLLLSRFISFKLLFSSVFWVFFQDSAMPALVNYRGMFLYKDCIFSCKFCVMYSLFDLWMADPCCVLGFYLIFVHLIASFLLHHEFVLWIILRF